MNYDSVIKFTSNTFGRCATSSGYYNNVNSWLEWYKGFVPSFHTRKVADGLSVSNIDIRQLRMAKRACEDWSSSLVNEKIDITITTQTAEKKTNSFIQGIKGDGGVLGTNNFTVGLSDALEQMFALGTSAIVISLDNLVTSEDGTILDGSKARININFHNATTIIPVSSRNGKITEVALLSEFTIKGKTFYNISVHLKEEDGYVIYNKTINSSGEEVTTDQSLIPIIRTKSYRPLFEIIKPAIANNVDLNSPMGISIYANSIDILKSIDDVYDASSNEVNTGRRLVFMDKAMLPTDERGNRIIPQDAKRNYFQFIGNDISSTDASSLNNVIADKTMQLRVSDIDSELQNQLNMFSTSCGLGTKYYQVTPSGIVTATQYSGERNDFMRNAKKQSNMLKVALQNVITEIIWVGKNIIGLPLSPDAKVSVGVSDGIIEDDSVERANDRQDVKDGIMTKAEYRAKWYNETELEASDKLKNI